MPAAKRTEIFDVDPEKFYEALIDYESYPEILSEVSVVEILESDEAFARVRYEVKVIKKFCYTLAISHNRPRGISWTLESGDLFKINSGSWSLSRTKDEKTQVDYSIKVDFKIFAPKSITQKIVAHSLPIMMQSFYRKAATL